MTPPPPQNAMGTPPMPPPGVPPASPRCPRSVEGRGGRGAGGAGAAGGRAAGAAVLADEGAVLVELALAPFSVVHQAVVALLLLYRPVQRGLAVGKRFVVFIAGSRRQTDTARVEKWG